MRSARSISAVDSHTEGMPTRVVTGGVPPIPGTTMAERRRHAARHLDGLRRFLVDEPRGHPAMSGALLQPPARPDADWGVVYIEASGFLPMCGHGTIGVATVLVETGMVEVTEPETTVRLDTPAGLVEARVTVRDGVAENVTLRNVASFALRRDAVVAVPGFGDVRYDLAYGGNFYAITDLAPLGLPFDRRRKDDLLGAGLSLMAAINDTDPPVHPADPLITGCKHVQLLAPGSDAAHSRNAMVIHPGWFDRSPCGTGTSARMAQLHARGELPLRTEFVNESLLGTRFTGRLVAGAEVEGLPAVIPEFTGRAWITGTATYLLDPADPFPEGFVF
ncbi:proline racemase family protein [Actinomadura bangladeshensis]|uniref:Proline racemase family protein n=1 Tax=Actinomadura bangladeshensis TaxID=453573 RepID=A0A6L9QGX9_9ACTN|nr:proline racemase family protein [Actinomadura bangladeshensis]NEA24306.1 proline racemase family protein [Actinomadura bangladeshensis]